MLWVGHIAGIRPGHDRLLLSPHALPGLDRIRVSLPLRGRSFEITVRKTGCTGSVSIKGDARVLHSGHDFVELEFPDHDSHVELQL